MMKQSEEDHSRRKWTSAGFKGVVFGLKERCGGRVWIWDNMGM